jgi:RHS repeat-associated protein
MQPPGVDNRFGFAGYLWDPFLQLYHVRHRVYDPMGGRWLQRDPIGIAGGWNLYEYVGGDPWGYTDPMGLAPQSNYFWDGLELLWHGGRYAPRPAETSELDAVRDHASDQMVDAYGKERLAGGESEGAMRFYGAAAAIGTGLRVAVNTAGVAVMIVTPDPTDAVLFGVAAKYGVTTLKKMTGKIVGETADGKEVVIKGADARSVREAFKSKPILGMEYNSKYLRHNLEAAGVKSRGPGFPEDAHHIVGDSQEAMNLRERMRKAEIDINSAENGMFLDREFHQRMLSNGDYRLRVIDALRKANSKAEFREGLNRLKTEIRAEEAEFLRRRTQAGGSEACRP